MAKADVERLLLAGGKDRTLRSKYDAIETMEDFVVAAGVDGYDFTVAELVEVLKDEGDSFESAGNPRCRQIWWT